MRMTDVKAGTATSNEDNKSRSVKVMGIVAPSSGPKRRPREGSRQSALGQRVVLYLDPVDLTWIKDYGALVAALVAAVAAITSGLLQAQRDRTYKTNDWLRQTRIPRYVSFLHAANAYAQAIFWTYGEADEEITGPVPKDVDFDACVNGFARQLYEVTLVGPAEVAKAAKIVQYSCWRYRDALTRNPFNYDQRRIMRAIADFTRAAQVSVGIQSDSDEVPSYRDWSESAGDSDD